MQEKFLFYLFGLMLWLSSASFCIAQDGQVTFSRPPQERNSENQITVSATVLENITVICDNQSINIQTNLKAGYWKLPARNALRQGGDTGEYFVIVARI